MERKVPFVNPAKNYQMIKDEIDEACFKVMVEYSVPLPLEKNAPVLDYKIIFAIRMEGKMKQIFQRKV